MVVKERWKPARIQCFPEPRDSLLVHGDATQTLGNGQHCQGCFGMALHGMCRAYCAAWREGVGEGGFQQCRRGGRSPAAPWEVEARGEVEKVSLLSTSRPPEISVGVTHVQVEFRFTCCLVGGGLANSSTLPCPAMFFLTLST